MKKKMKNQNRTKIVDQLENSLNADMGTDTDTDTDMDMDTVVPKKRRKVALDLVVLQIKIRQPNANNNK